MPFVSFLNLAFTIDVCPCLEAPRPSPWDHPNLDMYFRPKPVPHSLLLLER